MKRVLAATSVAACLVAVLPVASTTAAQAAAPPKDVKIPTDLRDVRYCEVIPHVTADGQTTSYVYNTLGYNYCPQGTWKATTPADVIAQVPGAQSASMNGPRHWVMDAIGAGGSSVDQPTLTVNGLTYGQRGVTQVPAGTPTVGSQPYVPSDVQRNTTYTYKAGKPLFELVDPNGHIYVMQSYASIIDPTLTYRKLPSMSGQLQLPPGWTYIVETPTQDVQLIAAGQATIVQDYLLNTYQLRA